MSESYTGVVDRLEGEQAVVLLESQGDVVDELVLDLDALPEPAQHPDAVLHLELQNDELVELTYDAEETERRTQRARERFKNLSQRPPTDDDPN